MYQQYFMLQFIYGTYKQNSEWTDTVIQTWLFKIQNDRHYCVYQIYVCIKIMRPVSHESHDAFGLMSPDHAERKKTVILPGTLP